MNLPALYAAVCAKRPELAVDGLTHKDCSCRVCGPRWTLTAPGSIGYPNDVIVSALILARWVEALPEWCDVTRVNNDTASGEQRWSAGLSEGPTPLEALAAYYLGETA